MICPQKSMHQQDRYQYISRVPFKKSLHVRRRHLPKSTNCRAVFVQQTRKLFTCPDFNPMGAQACPFGCFRLGFFGTCSAPGPAGASGTGAASLFRGAFDLVPLSPLRSLLPLFLALLFALALALPFAFGLTGLTGFSGLLFPSFCHCLHFAIQERGSVYI